MASDACPAPAYGEPALPPYTDGTDGTDPPAPPTATNTDTPPGAQKLWFQATDTTGLYRRRLILPANSLAGKLPDPYGASASSTPPPNYTETRTPLYTVRNHSHHSSASPRGSLSAKALRQPDLTVYSGEGDDGPVVATAMFHNKKLQRGIAEVRFFPRSSSDSPAPATDTPSTIITAASDTKHVFELSGQRLEWAETGPGEQRPESPTPAPPAPAPPVPAPSGLFGKFKKLVSSPPRTPPTSQPPKKTITLVLTALDAATGAREVVATYTELQPIASAEYRYRHVPPGYKDGHCGSLEVQMRQGVPRDVVVVTLAMLLEHERRETARKSNRAWGGALGVGGGFSG